MLEERYILARERLQELTEEAALEAEYQKYFTKYARFLLLVCDTTEAGRAGKQRRASLEELREENHRLYEDILPENYEHSYANPAYAAKCFEEPYGKILCVLAAEMQSTVPFAFEQNVEALVIRMELFLEIYGAFVCEKEENGALPKAENLQETIAFYKVGKRKDKDGTGKYQDRVERRVIDSDPVNNDDG